MKTRHCASTDGRPLITVPECDYRKLESALAEERRALARVTANYKKTVERYTEARADSERGDAIIAGLNRTVAQLQADLAAEREKVKRLVDAATFARKGCEFMSMFAECEILDQAIAAVERAKGEKANEAKS